MKPNNLKPFQPLLFTLGTPLGYLWNPTIPTVVFEINKHNNPSTSIYLTIVAYLRLVNILIYASPDDPSNDVFLMYQCWCKNEMNAFSSCSFTYQAAMVDIQTIIMAPRVHTLASCVQYHFKSFYFGLV
jgi:hypothetical protein